MRDLQCLGANVYGFVGLNSRKRFTVAGLVCVCFCFRVTVFIFHEVRIELMGKVVIENSAE